MIEIEGTEYFSSYEINNSGLNWRTKRVINKSIETTKPQVYFNSTLDISESKPLFDHFKKRVVKIEGFFKVELVDDDVLDSTFLNLFLTKNSLINGEQYISREPIKIKHLEDIHFNFINNPDIYSKLKSTILSNKNEYNKVTRFFNQLSTYFNNSELVSIFQKSYNNDANDYSSLLNEIALFQIPKEHQDKNLDWYGSISSDEKNYKVEKFNDDFYITIETLKSLVTQSEFSFLFHYLIKGFYQYIYLDTKTNPIAFIEFEKESKQWVEDAYTIKGFVSPFGNSQQSKNNIELGFKNSCCINNKYFPSKMSLITKSFEQLIEFVDRKKPDIESNKTKLITKNIIINKSLLYAHEIYCYIKLSEIELISTVLNIDINIKKIKQLSKNQGYEQPISSQQRNNQQTKALIKDKNIQIQDVVDYICESNNPSNNYDLFKYVLEGYVYTYKNESLPSFKIFSAFLIQNDNELKHIEIKVINKKPLEIIIVFKGREFKNEQLAQAYTRLKNKVLNS